MRLIVILATTLVLLGISGVCFVTGYFTHQRNHPYRKSARDRAQQKYELQIQKAGQTAMARREATGISMPLVRVRKYFQFKCFCLAIVGL